LNKLYDFQLKGAQFLYERRSALLADDMGLGKTIQAIVAADMIKAKRILVVCPASVKINWEREFKKWQYINRKTHIIGKTREFLPVTDIYIVNYHIVSHSNIFNQLKNIKFDLLICDEAHYLKGIKSQRTKAILGTKGIVHNCEYKWMLTGTPLLNRPIELYPMLKVLASERMKPYDKYISYCYRYCGARYDNFGFNTNGASHLEELNKRLKPFMLRRMKYQVLKSLPPRIYQTIVLEQTPETRRAVIAEGKTSKHQKEALEQGVELGELAQVLWFDIYAAVKTLTLDISYALT